MRDTRHQIPNTNNIYSCSFADSFIDSFSFPSHLISFHFKAIAFFARKRLRKRDQSKTLGYKIYFKKVFKGFFISKSYSYHHYRLQKCIKVYGFSVLKRSIDSREDENYFENVFLQLVNPVSPKTAPLIFSHTMYSYNVWVVLKEKNVQRDD